MKVSKLQLLSTAVAPVVAAFGIVSASPAAADGDCLYRSAGKALPTAQSRGGEIILAAGCKPCAAKAANPCAAKAANPCAAKAANPCAAKAANPCAAKATNPCAANPCAAKKPE